VLSDSKTDSLTGMGNRIMFNEFMIKFSRRNKKPAYSIVMIDMDHFKDINDTLGHLEGDNALRDMASIIKNSIRHEDFAVRFGGDEFILVINAGHDVKRLMERIQAAIDKQNHSRIRPYQIYISYGYDVYSPQTNMPIFAFLAKVDEKMYRQKEERKKIGLPSSITSDLPETSEEKNA
jgi:diguanylate cyclase (GGDEF)-like protein